MKKIQYKINKMYDAKRTYMAHKPEFDRAVLKTMKAGDYVFGSEIPKFEANLAQYLGVKHVIGVGNGTDALQIALMTLGLAPGSKVMLPAFDYISSTEMIKLLGFEPVYVDISDITFCMDSNKFFQKLVDQNIKVVILSHLFGQVNESHVNSIVKQAKLHNIFVIEDFAQAIGCKNPLRGDIGTTSFYTSKNLGCFGDGGAIFTNNKSIALYARMLGNHGNPPGQKYNHIYSGVNSRLDNIQASILNVRLKYLDKENKLRRKIAHEYDAGFVANYEHFFVPIEMSFHSYHQYVIFLRNTANRNKLRKFLKERGIVTEIYYPYYFGEDNTVAKACSKKVLALPMNPYLKNKEVQYIIKSVKEFFAKK